MTLPDHDHRIPPQVAAMAHGARVTPVWRNDYGGLTVCTDDGRYLKYGPRNAESRMADEAERMEWARRYAVVPEVLEVDVHTPPSIDALVVCHGDACCPNTLLDDAGRWTAHVDLGLLGTGDRWGDIAVAAMSTEWNFGPGWGDLLIESYGVEPDHGRLRYYRDLWNAT